MVLARARVAVFLCGSSPRGTGPRSCAQRTVLSMAACQTGRTERATGQRLTSVLPIDFLFHPTGKGVRSRRPRAVHQDRVVNESLSDRLACCENVKQANGKDGG